MLGKTDAIATIAVKDIGRARDFYRDRLGLELRDDAMEGVLTFGSGGSSLLVYQSENAGTNKATSATWAVGDVDAEVRALKDKGVTFERYDTPGMSHDGDVHYAGDHRVAWFKDPDGNVLAIVNGG